MCWSYLKGYVRLRTRPVCCKVSLQSLGFYDTLIIFVHNNNNNNNNNNKFGDTLRPIQLGVATPGGCEAAVHATRRYLATMPDDSVVVKLDFSNAFYYLHRDRMLRTIDRFRACIDFAGWHMVTPLHLCLVTAQFGWKKAHSRVTHWAHFSSAYRNYPSASAVTLQ